MKLCFRALETLIRDILTKSNIKPESDAFWMKLKQWGDQFLHVEMEKEKIESHAKKLSAAVDCLKVRESLSARPSC
jgi:hypothetical protein